MALGRSPLLILTLLLILGASIYITSLVFIGDGGEDELIYPTASAAELLPSLPMEGEAQLTALSFEVSYEIRPRARLLREDDGVALPLRLSYGDRAYAASMSSLAGSWAMHNRAKAGRNFVRLELPDGNVVYRILDLPAPDDGVVDLRLWGPAVLRGRVLDVEGRPLVAASVWGGLGDPAESSAWLRCDDQGAFEINLPISGRGLPLVVRAEGFVSRFRVLRVEGMIREGVDIHLDVAATLEIQLAAILTDPSVGRLFLRPAHGETRSQSYPFFLQHRGMAFDDRGRCRISDLPADSNLEILLSHPQVILPRARSAQVGMRERKHILQVPPVSTIRGRVLDPSGKPIAHAVLLSHRADESEAIRGHEVLLPPGAVIGHGRAIASSDATGAFSIAFAPQGVGAWLIRARAEGYVGMEMQLSTNKATVHQDIVLEPIAKTVGEPSLLFRLSTPGRRVIRKAGESWHDWPEGEDYAQPLSEPALIDVLVRVRSRETGIEREQLFSRVMVSGRVELEISGG